MWNRSLQDWSCKDIACPKHHPIIADTSYSFKGVNAFKHESVKFSYKKDLEALKYQIEALEKDISKIKFWKTSHYFGKSKPWIRNPVKMKAKEKCRK